MSLKEFRAGQWDDRKEWRMPIEQRRIYILMNVFLRWILLQITFLSILLQG